MSRLRVVVAASSTSKRRLSVYDEVNLPLREVSVGASSSSNANDRMPQSDSAAADIVIGRAVVRKRSTMTATYLLDVTCSATAHPHHIIAFTAHRAHNQPQQRQSVPHTTTTIVTATSLPLRRP